jgi:serine phosphatase RsbU (regulator of sigma subunit)
LVALGDVSGRGLATSRLKDLAIAEMAGLAGSMTDPAAILSALNRDLLEAAGPCLFATLLVALIDGDCHELTLASAGHPAPLFRHADRRIESIGEETIGFPLWIDPSRAYENVTVSFGPSDIVIFFSDGLTAVVNNQELPFDANRLRQATTRAPANAASVGQAILNAISLFRAGRPQMDDITLLCVGRNRIGDSANGRSIPAG